MSEEVAASIGDVLAENERLKQQLALAEKRASIASEAYHQQQDTQREHEARYQAAVERAQAAEQNAEAWHQAAQRLERKAEKTAAFNRDLNIQSLTWMERAGLLERAARRLVVAWRTQRQYRYELADALQGLLDDPYGCPMCDYGRLRNPGKGHMDDCPYEIVRAVLAAGSGE